MSSNQQVEAWIANLRFTNQEYYRLRNGKYNRQSLNNKSPGPDGYNEMYTSFKDRVSPLLFKATRYNLEPQHPYSTN